MELMITSEFKEHITIQKETTTVNSLGQPAKTYDFLKDSYAKADFRGGDTQYTDGALPFSSVDFIIRYDPDMTSDRTRQGNYKRRIQWGGQDYQIKHIFTEERNAYMRIKCIVWEDE